MADHISWEHVVQMCRQVHPEEEEEEVAAAGVEAQQLDLDAAAAEAEVAEAVAEAAERAEGRLAATRAEIANAMAELADARAELAEARAAMAAPPADAVIHDIADDDPPCPAASSAPATSGFCSRPSSPWLGTPSAVRLGWRRRKPTAMRRPWLVGSCAPTWTRSSVGPLLPRGSSRRTGSWRSPSPPGTKRWRRRLGTGPTSSPSWRRCRPRARQRTRWRRGGGAEEAAAAGRRPTPWPGHLRLLSGRGPRTPQEAAEALERRRRHEEVSDLRRARRKEAKRSRFDDGAGPSGGQ
ncbi:hypothetical protein QYE76_001366 [Lolium multiflorum]|uniref:Uncharacterized protein n=1 Tax=Lolium multiflorum TaxID=4521 RepID=A0AAD8RJD8_LOLMU|nr:hypothetical protein QYE76_001366 [Lolium multiflorum]